MGFDRVRSLIVPEPHSVGPQITFGGSIDQLGPASNLPIDRTQNQFRYAGQLLHKSGPHTWRAGFELLRRQINGSEYSSQRGVITFAADFGRDAMTNFRLGEASRYSVGIGDPHRGFRNWDTGFYAGDDWRVSSRLVAELWPALSAGDHAHGGEWSQHHRLWLPVRQFRAALRLRLPAGRPLGRAPRRLRYALRRDLSGHFSAGALRSARRDQTRNSQSGSARSAGRRRYPARRAQHHLRASRAIWRRPTRTSTTSPGSPPSPRTGSCNWATWGAVPTACC